MDPKPLSRAQLAKICGNDPEAIRLFERLFQVAGQVLPDQIDGSSLTEFGDPTSGLAELQKSVDAQELVQLRAELSEVSARLEQVAAVALPDELTIEPPVREFRRACYGQFYDTTTQTAAAINTAYSVSLNTVDISQGVYLSGEQVTVAESGVYNFQLSVQLDKTSGGVGHFYLWFSKNGTDIPNSASTVRIQGNDAEVFTALNLFIPMAADDYVEIKWSVDDVSVEMTAFPASAPVPLIPSIILTVSNNLEGVK